MICSRVKKRGRAEDGMRGASVPPRGHGHPMGDCEARRPPGHVGLRQADRAWTPRLPGRLCFGRADLALRFHGTGQHEVRLQIHGPRILARNHKPIR